MTEKLSHPDHPAHPVHPDGDAHKGAVESQSPHDTPDRPDGHSNLADQLPHRRSGGTEFEGADSDFPEPGSNPEHSGQHR